MHSDHYVWFIWASAFLIPWAILYAALPGHRRMMLWTSIFTMPMGLTEPIFVPKYWNPPSLFDLAQRTGFDIESLIFCFAIAGIGSVFYSALTGRSLTPVDSAERRRPLHALHYLALALPFIIFVPLYFVPWNPIIPAIAAMLLGAGATILCRPDLIKKTWIGGLLFVALYALFLQGLHWFSPGYIERVWRLQGLLGVEIAGMPIEELLFGFSFGLYWAGAYEHFAWQRGAAPAETSGAPTAHSHAS